MTTVQIDRKCPGCGRPIKQLVEFEEKNGEIAIGAYQHTCQCKSVLPKPTPAEVKTAPRAIKNLKDFHK